MTVSSLPCRSRFFLGLHSAVIAAVKLDLHPDAFEYSERTAWRLCRDQAPVTDAAGLANRQLRARLQRGHAFLKRFDPLWQRLKFLPWSPRFQGGEYLVDQRHV